jgi:hypothetical protein
MLLKEWENGESLGVNPKALEPDPTLKALADKAKALTTDKFLSAEELSLTERQRKALIDTLELMETRGIDNNKYINGKRFNMSHWITNYNGKNRAECGSICCIGGTASLLAGKRIKGEYEDSIFHDEAGNITVSTALANLFFNWGSGPVTVDRAAKELRNYLETANCPSNWAKKEVP